MIVIITAAASFSHGYRICVVLQHCDFLLLVLLLYLIMQHFCYFLRAFLIEESVRIWFSLLVGLMVCHAEFIE